MAPTQRSNLSKLALGDGHGENSPYFDGWKAYDSDPFHPTDNPHGVIQMGLAENQLCFGMIQEWVVNHPGASICTSDGAHDFKDVAIFQDYHGLTEFRKAVAKFMSRVRGNKATFDPDRVVMAGGATGAHEMIAFCLADPGDAFLIPTPYYPGFDRDLKWRTGLQILPIHCDSSNNFQLTMHAVESAYNNAVSSNVRVKGILITNPSNPLGTALNRATLEELLRFAADKRVHLVCDEIYAATLSETESGISAFVSVSEVLEAAEEIEMEKARDFVHVVYSLSKDMGLPGFRVGVVYSYNDAVLTCARRMSSFGLVSTQTQRLVARMLSDEGFIDRFLSESAGRLSRRRKALEGGLDAVGIACMKASAGLFSWMDLRGLLDDATVEAEMALWRVILREVKLNVSPGSSFHCAEPGWFRVCFANMDENTLQVALRRIRSFMARKRDGVVERATKRCRSDRLQISLSFRRMDEINMRSPPNSPVPRSPLIPTRT